MIFNLEHKGLVKKGLTSSIITDLRNVFFKKHKIEKDNFFNINIYIRCGDLQGKNDNFEFKIFSHLYKLVKNKDNIKINVISAGNIDQMNNIRKQFEIFENINFILNCQKAEEVFMIMVKSDLLIYNFSFPFYCIIILYILNSTKRIIYESLLFKDEMFWIIIKTKNYQIK